MPHSSIIQDLPWSQNYANRASNSYAYPVENWKHLAVLKDSVINTWWPSDAIYMMTNILVSIGSVNGLLPDGIKPFPGTILIYHQDCYVALT